MGSDSKSGSKSDLNESNMPLLDDDSAEKAGETPEKEVIEMEVETKEEKEDSGNEKKVKKPKKEPGPSCIETFSSHGFAPVWTLSFVLFSQTKVWLYKLFSALLSIPLSLVWCLLFAVLTVTHVWVV